MGPCSECGRNAGFSDKLCEECISYHQFINKNAYDADKLNNSTSSSATKSKSLSNILVVVVFIFLGFLFGHIIGALFAGWLAIRVIRKSNNPKGDNKYSSNSSFGGGGKKKKSMLPIIFVSFMVAFFSVYYSVALQEFGFGENFRITIFGGGIIVGCFAILVSTVSSFGKLISSADKDDLGFQKDNTSFNNHKDAGDYGEKLLEIKLKKLKGGIINGYLTSENMIFNDRNFELDFATLVPNVGLVIMEVKYFSGEVYCTNHDTWKQKNTQGMEVDCRNASKQVIRTSSLFKSLLTSYAINKWPVVPLVVFTHPNAVIYPAIAPENPQTEIIKLDSLEYWLKKQSKNDLIQFTNKDFNDLREIIERTEKEYATA